MKENKPEYINPMQAMMQDGMPQLPNIINNAMPIALPRMNFDDGIISMVFGTYKRRKMEESTALEAKIAQNCRDAVFAKFDTISRVLTYSAETADKLAEFEHRKTMRGLEVQVRQADVYFKTAQAQQAGHEAELSRIDLEIKSIQFNKMKEESNGAATS